LSDSETGSTPGAREPVPCNVAAMDVRGHAFHGSLVLCAVEAPLDPAHGHRPARVLPPGGPSRFRQAARVNPTSDPSRGIQWRRIERGEGRKLGIAGVLQDL